MHLSGCSINIYNMEKKFDAFVIFDADNLVSKTC